MANYYGNGRSNYVKVKDKENFKEMCSLYGLLYWENGDLVGCGANDDGGEPNTELYDRETGNATELPDFISQAVPELLEEGQVFIWMHNGAEKLRYLVGYTIAVNSKGEYQKIDLGDIYDKAKELGDDFTTCEY